jgi:hypothetical protein
MNDTEIYCKKTWNLTLIVSGLVRLIAQRYRITEQWRNIRQYRKTEENLKKKEPPCREYEFPQREGKCNG